MVIYGGAVCLQRPAPAALWGELWGTEARAKWCGSTSCRPSSWPRRLAAAVRPGVSLIIYEAARPSQGRLGPPARPLLQAALIIDSTLQRPLPAAAQALPRCLLSAVALAVPARRPLIINELLVPRGGIEPSTP